MNIFVINLNHRKDRLAKMSERLAKCELPWERVAAVDGRDSRLDDKVDWPKHHYYNQFLPPLRGAIGCYFSHRSIWERMVEQNIPRALVLEDDIAPLPSWDKDILDIDIAALGLDSLRLDSSRELGPMPMSQYFEMQIGRWRAKNVNSWGAGAYLITRAGAAKCLKPAKMWMMADDFFMMNRVVGLRTALLFPNMWFHPEESSSDVSPGENFYSLVPSYKKRYSRVITALIRERERLKYMKQPFLSGKLFA